MNQTAGAIEARLWEAADELRANSKLKSSEYSVPVLGLVFLRYADHKFQAAAKEPAGQGGGDPGGAKPVEDKGVLDWRKRQQSRADVKAAIETVLDAHLPRVYTPEIFEQKATAVFQHVYEAYYGAGQGIYPGA